MLVSAFLISLAALLFFPRYLPVFDLFFFAPYLALTLTRRSLFFTLAMTLVTGTLTDLFISTPRFGITALSSMASLLILSGQRQLFFADKTLVIPLITLLFSFCMRFVRILCDLGFGIPIHSEALGGSLLLLPFADALFALLGFVWPYHLINHMMRKKERIDL